jgi:hypothetical protein
MATAISGDTGVDQLQAAALTPFFGGANQSLTANGYQKFPSGLIIQWGTTAAIAGDVQVTNTFPVPFPNAFLTAAVTAVAADPHTDNWGMFLSASKTQITVARGSIGGNTQTNSLRWIAIGF